MLTYAVFTPRELALSAPPRHSVRAHSSPAAFIPARSTCGTAVHAWRKWGSVEQAENQRGGLAAPRSQPIPGAGKCADVNNTHRLAVRASATRQPPLRRQQQQQPQQQQRRRKLEHGEFQFSSERSVSIPCPQIYTPSADAGAAAVAERAAVRAAGSGDGGQQVVSVDEYLSEETARIVQVVFPDSKRLKRVDADLWRVYMRPVTFFGVTATPVCLLRVYHDGTSLRLFSNHLQLEFQGVNPAFQNIPLRLSLDGQLSPTAASSPSRNARGNTSSSSLASSALTADCLLGGSVQLGLIVHLPMPLSLLPQAAVEAVGNAILDNILCAMQASLLNGLVKDYTVWAKEEAGRRVGGVAADGVPATRGIDQRFD